MRFFLLISYDSPLAIELIKIGVKIRDSVPLNPDRQGRGGLEISIFAGRPKWMAPKGIRNSVKCQGKFILGDNFCLEALLEYGSRAYVLDVCT